MKFVKLLTTEYILIDIYINYFWENLRIKVLKSLSLYFEKILAS